MATDCSGQVSSRVLGVGRFGVIAPIPAGSMPQAWQHPSLLRSLRLVASQGFGRQFAELPAVVPRELTEIVETAFEADARHCRRGFGSNQSLTDFLQPDVLHEIHQRRSARCE